MRIISGCARGKRLKSPGNYDIRPTSDYVKEALFNIIGNNIPDSVFMDIFAGTGNVGFEALSRGAKEVVFVESARRSIALIRDNLTLTGLNNCHIIHTNAFSLTKKGLTYDKYDIIFADPPYGKGLSEKILYYISDNDWLNTNGLFIIEQSKNDKIVEMHKNMGLVRRCDYGDTILLFYRANIEYPID